MKKLFMMLVVVLLFSIPANAFETLTSTGVGWLTQKNQPSSFAYFGGFDIPIVTKDSSGFRLSSEVTYLYSDGIAGGEVQVIRVVAFGAKNIWSTPTMKIWIGMGSGTYYFTKVGSELNPDGNDQGFGVLLVRLGTTYNGITLYGGLEAVQVKGPDLYVPTIGLSFGF